MRITAAGLYGILTRFPINHKREPLSRCKGNTNRAQNKINSFIFYAEMQFTFCKGNKKIERRTK